MFNIRGYVPRSIPSKVPFVKDLIASSNHIMFALTETWLEGHKDAEVYIQNYLLFRQDRPTRSKSKGRHVGGVALYLLESWAPDAVPVLQFSNDAVDILCVHIPTKNIIVSVVYRQPDDSKHDHPSTNKELSEALAKLNSFLSDLPSPTPDIIIMGDMNLPHVVPETWKHGITKSGISSKETEMIESIQETVDEFLLEQLVDQPTHEDGNMLDLFFTNNPDILHSISCNETIQSDHHIVTFKSTYILSKTSSNTPNLPPEDSFDNLNFFSDEVNWDEINSKLSQYPWEDELSHLDHPTMINKFCEVCLEICKKLVPSKKAKNKTLCNKIKIPKHRRILMRRRNKVHKHLRRNRLSISRRNRLKQELVDIEMSLQRDYSSEKKLQEDHAVASIKTNSKHFYSYAKKFSKTHVGIGPLTNSNSETVSCPQKMAEMLSEQYASVWTKPKVTNTNDTHQNNSGFLLSDISCTPSDLEIAINELTDNASPGPDKYPAILLKKCKTSLSYPLSLIWRKSLDTTTINDTQKSANVIPIHKGGSKGVPKNYRPIALTSHLIKIFEKVVRNAIVAFLEEHDLFNPSQHGFRFGRSCLSQLLEHYDKITRLLAEGHDVDIVYVDFAKAFDKVDINIAMEKIRKLGISGLLADWIYCFLSNRTQQVVVNSCKSKPKEVISGVPQGSVLGPLIFLILISDIDRDIATSFLSSFADDTRIGQAVDCENDAYTLQQDLQSVYEWCEDNNMAFNSDKFEYMSYVCHKRNEEFHTPIYYDNNGKQIEKSKNVKDLGVYMSDDATFSFHINSVASKAKHMCAWILRTFITRDLTPMITLYKSLVLPHMDYCSQLWNPCSRAEINKLEMIQRSFVKKIKGMYNLTYWQQLKQLKLFSLERRRERYRIIYLWKMIECKVPQVGTLESYIHPRHGRLCSVLPVKTAASQKVQNICHSSFTIHAPKLFNLLPEHIRNITDCSVESFKTQLDSYLKTIPDEPQIQGYTSCRRADSNSLCDMHKVKC